MIKSITTILVIGLKAMILCSQNDPFIVYYQAGKKPTSWNHEEKSCTEYYYSMSYEDRQDTSVTYYGNDYKLIKGGKTKREVNHETKELWSYIYSNADTVFMTIRDSFSLTNGKIITEEKYSNPSVAKVMNSFRKVEYDSLGRVHRIFKGLEPGSELKLESKFDYFNNGYLQKSEIFTTLGTNTMESKKITESMIQYVPIVSFSEEFRAAMEESEQKLKNDAPTEIYLLTILPDFDVVEKKSADENGKFLLEKIMHFNKNFDLIEYIQNDPKGQKEIHFKFKYNEQNLLISTEDVTQNRFLNNEYLPNGKPKIIYEGMDNRTEYEYDKSGRLSQIRTFSMISETLTGLVVYQYE